jgi:tRNA 2-thiouridine synthesizing protein A
MSTQSPQAAAVTLDLKGLLCPLPIVKVAQAIKKVNVGDTVEAVATDPGVLADVPAWARTSGNEVVTLERQDGQIRFVVRRLR